MSDNGTGHFAVPLGRLAEPFLAGLAARLDGLPGLGRTERVVVHDAVGDTLLVVLERKLTRLLVLELNAARLTGRLRGVEPQDRWAEFLELASSPGFWRDLAPAYPTLRARLDILIGNRCAAGLALAGHFAIERTDLAVLLAGPAGDLLAVQLGAGDSHRGGHTVAQLRCAGGRVLYKPRSVAVDLRLQNLLDAVLDGPRETRIRVPHALDRGDHGWVEHIPHRYCTDAAELTAFYRGIGHWLAVMRLVGGSDLHAENLIACGPVPVVVDCETLLTPHDPTPPTGFGLAVDRATDLVGQSVLRTGLLPHRGVALGWRGADMSASGSLPDEQPTVTVPVVVDAGTDTARIQRVSLRAEVRTANHPSREAFVARHWPDVFIDEVGVDLTQPDTPDAVDRARAHAELLPAAVAADEWYDVSIGMAGAIEPLLRLAARTGERRWLDLADDIGDRLAGAARIEDDRACWPNARSPQGLGGFSHGSSGVGWALGRLAEATGRGTHRELARAAFTFEDGLWSPAHAGWRDLRVGATITHAWCNGSAGIGLAAADGLQTDEPATDGLVSRHRRVLTRATAACWTDLGWNHTLCRHEQRPSWLP